MKIGDFGMCVLWAIVLTVMVSFGVIVGNLLGIIGSLIGGFSLGAIGTYAFLKWVDK